jgi:DNA-binding protein H-NS
MAKYGNGRLTEKSVSNWFATMEFDRQQGLLAALGKAHGKTRQTKIDELKGQLAVLEGRKAPTSPNGSARRANGKVKRGKGKRKVGKVAAKFRDPKTGETWSGRGRMARWLADKVKGGEKTEKYLA